MGELQKLFLFSTDSKIITAASVKELVPKSLEHNVFVDTHEAVIQFNEVGGTQVLGAGEGAHLKGNVFLNNIWMMLATDISSISASWLQKWITT